MAHVRYSRPRGGTLNRDPIAFRIQNQLVLNRDPIGFGMQHQSVASQVPTICLDTLGLLRLQKFLRPHLQGEGTDIDMDPTQGLS